MPKQVLSTKVEQNFAQQVEKYCESNGLTPSSLIRSLLEEELNKKTSITSIYADIAKRLKKIDSYYQTSYSMHLELMDRSISTELLFIGYVLKDKNMPMPIKRRLERMMEQDRRDLANVREKLEEFRAWVSQRGRG